MQAFFIIAKVFFAVCLLRKGPQDLPANSEFLFVCLLASFASSTLLGLSSQVFIMAVAASLLEQAFLLFFTYVFLRLRSLSGRWMQTCTALTGTGTLFNVAAMPLFGWFARLGQGQTVEWVYLLFFLVLVIWSIAVMAHIFKHALSVSFPVALIVSILLIWCMVAANAMLFPQEV